MIAFNYKTLKRNMETTDDEENSYFGYPSSLTEFSQIKRITESFLIK